MIWGRAESFGPQRKQYVRVLSVVLNGVVISQLQFIVPPPEWPAPRFTVVFTRGHGAELAAQAAVRLAAGAGEEQARVKTFRKWW